MPTATPRVPPAGRRPPLPVARAPCDRPLVPPASPTSRLALALDATARAEILAAVRECEGNLTRAARALGVSHRQVCRECERLGLWEEIDRMGFPRQAGPARGPR